MCGITGVIQKNRDIDNQALLKMINTLSHRGPDNIGTYVSSKIGFAHSRLAIIDPGELSNQPMHCLDRYVIVFNGEIYNYLELKEELEKKKYIFNTKSDTEVIVAAFDYWGTKCLDKFNGMWAFVIYDRKDDKVFISRDRFGIKPLYFFKSEDFFIFGSEIKSILKHPSFKEVELHSDVLQEYIEIGPKEYSSRTPIEGIRRFPKASCFLGESSTLFNSFKPEKFWQLNPNIKTEKYSEVLAKKYAEKYFLLLKDSISLRLRADVRVGSALSGGLDSSSIVYIINELLVDQGLTELQETFSCVYKTPGTEDCDESYFIDKLVSQLCVKSNQVEPNESEISSEHYKMMKVMETPPESTCMSGWHTFRKVAREGVKVTLDGQGADECLGGYLHYIPAYLASIGFFQVYKQAILFFKIPNVKYYVLKGIILNHFRQIFGKKLSEFFFQNLLNRRVYFNLNEALADSVNKGLVNLLHYSDRVSMGQSIESRVPFLDYRLVEFLFSVPACYKMHNGWTKYLARLAFDGKLPNEVCWRRDKMGWPIPEKFWLKGAFGKHVQSVINRSQLLTVINYKEKDITNVKKLIRVFNASVFGEIFFKK